MKRHWLRTILLLLQGAATASAATGAVAQIDPRILFHVTLDTIADFIPHDDADRLSDRLGHCLALNIKANHSRSVVADGFMSLKDGSGILLGVPAPSLTLVEPTRSGVVFATLGDAGGRVGTRYRLVEMPSSSATNRPRAVGIAGGSLLDDEGARWFYRHGRAADRDAEFRLTGSDRETLRALDEGRVGRAVIRYGIGRPDLDLPHGAAVTVESDAIPYFGLARPLWLSPDDVEKFESCVFALRIAPELAARLGGGDRFVPMTSGTDLDAVRAIVGAAGGRFDHWNYWVASRRWK